MVDRPAFPSGNMTTTSVERGMTLRDYFAAQVTMASVTLISKEGDSICPAPTDIAEWAYAIADAMLVERQKQQ